MQNIEKWYLRIYLQGSNGETDILSLFLCMVLESVLVSFFYTWLTSSPSTTYWRDCLSPLYIFASFVKDKVSIDMWIYLCAFYFVPLIYISVFVPVPYCLDDCGFVVEPEVRQVDSSSSILLSQDCFGYSRFYLLPYKLSNYLFQFCKKYHW